MLTFQIESIGCSPIETENLWAAHWSETEGYRKSPMNPDWDQFYTVEQYGQSRYFTARDDGKLVGHIYYIIHKNRHNQTKDAVEDFFYFLPEARRGLSAIKLLRFAISSLKDDGCVEIGMSSKLTARDISPLLKRVGFRHVANWYVLK